MLKTMTARATIVAFLAGLSMSAHAIADTQRIDIPAGSLLTALETLAKQTNVDLVYQDAQIEGLRTSGVAGELSAQDAVVKLLQGTPLEVRKDKASGAILITIPPASAPATSSLSTKPSARNGEGQGEEKKSFWSWLRLAQSSTPSTSQTDARDVSASNGKGEGAVEGAAQSQKTLAVDEVFVTGTRIRGGTSTSPLITIGAEKIREEGFTDLGEVIRSVPQNFSGGQNPGVLGGSDDIANQNITGGSSLNLRGLGPDASLTLLNGRRMSYGGYVQAVDISAIPVEAVERIEIVADGASAIYGSDAVGGVGNVILKRDFDGATVGARYGTASEGGLTTREYTAVAGTTWASGGLIATYKDSSTDPVYSHQRDYTDTLFEPNTIYPGSDLRSGLLSAHQRLGDTVELRLDALRTKRTSLQYNAWSTGYYDYTQETTTSLVSPSIEISLPKDWSLSVSGSWGKDESLFGYATVITATGESSDYNLTCYCNESRAYEVSAEGPLFALGGGDARLAIGAGYRKNSYLSRNQVRGTVGDEGDESSRFGYAELSLPLIGAGSVTAGAQRLVLTTAVRSEDYSSFGAVTTPKLGLIYDPGTDVTLKASWGKSFKAPTLLQKYQSRYAFLDPAPYYGGVGYAPDATALMVTGGNPDLNAERARTWSASLAFHPAALPNLEAELTGFDIDYTARVVYPIGNSSQALSNPINAPFIDYSPSAEQLAQLIATYQFYNSTGADFDPRKVVALISDPYTNATGQKVKGADLSGSYWFDLGDSRLTIRGSASWLSSSQRTTVAQSAFDRAGTLFNPAKLNSRIGAVWSLGGYTSSIFANYIDGVTDTVAMRKTASFTTFDATLRYATEERGGAWSGLELALSAQNLFDRAPPLYTPSFYTYVPYDSTNYSAIGRLLSASISKHW
ncbi:MAG: TonB-dependent receptor [Gammaproteobacteria bacterium]